ncbi:hypothetical protein KFE25_008143 [Diacronema lutheri]|uniref:Rab-GAP TBC domain-containing protein n=1 Tax=Diacronema lutheri TaxID=2081491 RepID=A0A8J6CBP2_DIALT|nr:hypothetical protein KFE25_008143 [Diacronema lutheri]
MAEDGALEWTEPEREWDAWGFAVAAPAPARRAEDDGVGTPPASPTHGGARVPWRITRPVSLGVDATRELARASRRALARSAGSVASLDARRERARVAHELRWHAYWRRLHARARGSPIRLHADDDELRALVRGGVSVAMRGSVWPALCGLPGRLAHVAELYHHLAADHGADDLRSAEAIEAIDKDIERTWPRHARMDARARGALRRVLVALARAEPEIGYCQGLNEVAAALLLFAPDEACAFGMLLHIVRTALPPDWYGRTLAGSLAEARVLGELIGRFEPAIGARMAQLGVEPSLFCTPWLLRLFVDALPFGVTLRVWDCVLLASADGARSTRTGRGADVLLRVAIALLRTHRHALLRAPHAGAFVRALADSARATREADADALVAAAFRVGWSLQPPALSSFPPQAELDALRLAHRAAVEAIAERLLRARSARSDAARAAAERGGAPAGTRADAPAQPAGQADAAPLTARAPAAADARVRAATASPYVASDEPPLPAGARADGGPPIHPLVVSAPDARGPPLADPAPPPAAADVADAHGGASGEPAAASSPAGAPPRADAAQARAAGAAPSATPATPPLSGGASSGNGGRQAPRTASWSGRRHFPFVRLPRFDIV